MYRVQIKTTDWSWASGKISCLQVLILWFHARGNHMQNPTFKAKLSAGSQVEELEKLVDKEARVAESKIIIKEREREEGAAFQRNPRIARTPPNRDRSTSLPEPIGQRAATQLLAAETEDLTMGNSDEEYADRRPAKKRKNASPLKVPANIKKQEGKRDTSSIALKNFCRKIESVQDIAKTLTQLVNENPKTQKGIKRAVEKLESVVEHISKDRDVLFSLSAAQPAQMRKKLVDSTSQTEEVHADTGNTKSVGTQTNPRKAGMVQSLMYIKTFAEWEEAADKQWEKDLLSFVTIKEKGNILNTDREAVKLCWIHREESWQNRRQKALKDKYPELMGADGDFEILEQTSKLRVGGGTFAQKIIKAVHDGSEKSVWEMLTKTKEEMEGRRMLAMYEIQGITVQRLKKLVSWVFHNSEVQVEIYPVQDARKNAQTMIPSNQARTRNSYAIVVEEKGKQYKDVLEKVKTVIKDTSLAKCVKGLRSTREGNKLVITLEKNEESLAKIGSLIENTHQAMEVRTLRDGNKAMKPILIKGMDALTIKEEVIAAVENKIGTLAGRQFRLSETMPNINNTSAITMWLDSESADKLIADGSLRVGIVNCRVEEKIKITRCRKCWEYGHTAKDCTGQDLTKACYKCGKEGHEAKTCENEEECPLCRCKGHRADTGKCKIFLRALAEARRTKRAPQPQTLAQNTAYPLAQGHEIPQAEEEIPPSEEAEIPPRMDTDVSQTPSPTEATFLGYNA